MLNTYVNVSSNYSQIITFYMIWNGLAILSYFTDYFLRHQTKKYCNYFKAIFPVGILFLILIIIFKRLGFENRVCLCVYSGSVFDTIKKGMYTYVGFNIEHGTLPFVKAN